MPVDFYPPRGRREILIQGAGMAAGYTYVAAGNVTSFTVSGLDAYGADYFRLIYDVAINTGALPTALYFRPNAANTNCTSVYGGATATPGADAGTFTELVLGIEGDAERILWSGDAYFENTLGLRRAFRAHIGNFETGTPRAERVSTASGFWNDTSTVLTSIQVIANAASGIGTGARARLYAGYAR